MEENDPGGDTKGKFERYLALFVYMNCIRYCLRINLHLFEFGECELIEQYALDYANPSTPVSYACKLLSSTRHERT